MRDGEEVAADKGFEQVAHLLAALGCKLNYPPKRFVKVGLTSEEADETANQANLRIHIERAYSRTKQYRFLSSEVRISQLDMIGKVFRIVFFVGNNFHRPLTNTDA